MKSKYYFYILKCKNEIRYYGHTNDLTERIKDHLNGEVSFTKNKQPKLAYFKEFDTCSEAFKCEMRFKNGKTRKETIEKLIDSFPNAKCQGFNSQTASPTIYVVASATSTP